MGSHLQSLIEAKVESVKTRVALEDGMRHGAGNPSQYVRASVVVEVCGQRITLSCTYPDRTWEKKIIRAMGTNRNVLRSKSTRHAMDVLIRSARDAAAKAVAGTSVDEGKFQKRIDAALKKRDETRRRREYQAAVDALEAALSGPSSILSLEEVTDIWKQCHVQSVMEA